MPLPGQQSVFPGHWLLQYFQRACFIVFHICCSLYSMSVMWWSLQLQCGYQAQDLTLRACFARYHVDQRHCYIMSQNHSLLNAEQLSCHIKASSRFNDPRNYISPPSLSATIEGSWMETLSLLFGIMSLLVTQTLFLSFVAGSWTPIINQQCNFFFPMMTPRQVFNPLSIA